MRSEHAAGLIGYYRDFDPGGETLRGAWEGSDSLVFIDRERPGAEPWVAPKPEPDGMYSFYVQTTDTFLTVAVNGHTAWTGHCPPGSMQFARPGDLLRAEGTGTIRSIQASFTPAHVADEFGECFLGSGTMELRSLRHDADFGLGLLARQHEEAMAYGFSGSELHFQLLRQAMLNRIVFSHATRPLNGSLAAERLVPARLRRLIDYIQGNLADGLDLSSLAAIAGTSRAHFARAFRNTTGFPPHAFIRNARTVRAMDLTRRSTLPLAEIARRCGFHDSAHLSNTFRVRIGRSPIELRRGG